MAERALAVLLCTATRFLIVGDDVDMRRNLERIIDENWGRRVCSAAFVEDMKQDVSIDYLRIVRLSWIIGMKDIN